MYNKFNQFLFLLIFVFDSVNFKCIVYMTNIDKKHNQNKTKIKI